MANAVYPLYKQSLMQEAAANKSLDQTGSNAPYTALVTTSAGYTYSASHQFYSSLTNIVGTPQPNTTPVVDTSATFKSDNITFTAVTGTVVGAIVIYRQNAGANTTWRLVLYEDTSVTGLPVTPNGGNIVITWNAAGIFTLSDARSKTDLMLLAFVKGVPIVSFRYKTSKRRHIGSLAQSVQRKLKAAVKERDDGMLAVDYGQLAEYLAF
jgi:hypothetical protein